MDKTKILIKPENNILFRIEDFYFENRINSLVEVLLTIMQIRPWIIFFL